MMKGLTESLLPQPPSFIKKKSYDVHQVLGTGTFGKVVVRPLIRLKWFNSFDWFGRPFLHPFRVDMDIFLRGLHGTSQSTK
jgi:hypothetical protein